MKAKDLAVLILVVGFGFMLSYFSFNSLLKKQKVKTYRLVKIIDNNIESPRKDVFTENSINPAVQILIGDEKEENK